VKDMQGKMPYQHIVWLYITVQNFAVFQVLQGDEKLL
jgi:hypothetical protein